MWLAGMREALVGLCALVALLLWLKGRYFVSLCLLHSCSVLQGVCTSHSSSPASG